MENFNLYNTKEIKFIKILFIALVSFLIIFLLSIIFLKINDTVSFDEGHIYANNPKVKINAPDEVKVLSVNIKEGDYVSKGDTLLILENKKILSKFNASNLDINTNTEKISILEKLISKFVKKKKAYKDLIGIQSNIYKTDANSTLEEIKVLRDKIKLSKEQTNIISDRYQSDSLLYEKGAISKLEFLKQKNKAIDDKKYIFEMLSNHKKQLNKLENIHNNHDKTDNELQREIIEIENKITECRKDILELKSKIKNKKINLNYISDELNRLAIIAPNNGTISNLFNTKQHSNIVLKGKPLITISPKTENYYAKIFIPEKDLIYIKKGQEVNMKVDAYSYYKFGPITGAISYISLSEDKDEFYCLVDLKPYKKHIKLKAGYKFKGEVIIERMKLYQYITKVIFNEIDNTIHE